MKFEPTHGEARKVLEGELEHTIHQLELIRTLVSGGCPDTAYKQLNYEVINAFLENLENAAADES